MAVAVSIVRADWKSTKPNPDEEMLKETWRAELDTLERAMNEEANLARRQQNALLPLLRAGGLDEGDMESALAESRQLSRQSLKESDALVQKPAFDVTRMHEQDLELVKTISAKMTTPAKTTTWSGYVLHPEYAGHWMSWNGETEEVPAATEDPAKNRLDMRAQAFGEGWWDADGSDVHAYLAFRITPPSWGQLEVFAHPWLHGFYNLYADDSWYKSEKASAEVSTWMDLHQSFWRPRSYRTRFRMAGDELHPTRFGRIDAQFSHGFHTAVGEGDIVTIRVGVRLNCYAKAAGGRARLDFRTANANYVLVPYVYWRLRQ
jgi:hypothetical protein